MSVIGGLAGLGAFVCFIIVLVKQFQEAGIIHGIIGIITCQIWTFIWGWINSGRFAIRNLMLAWTVLWILAVVFGAAGGLLSFSYGTP